MVTNSLSMHALGQGAVRSGTVEVQCWTEDDGAVRGGEREGQKQADSVREEGGASVIV